MHAERLYAGIRPGTTLITVSVSSVPWHKMTSRQCPFKVASTPQHNCSFDLDRRRLLA